MKKLLLHGEEAHNIWTQQIKLLLITINIFVVSWRSYYCYMTKLLLLYGEVVIVVGEVVVASKGCCWMEGW